MNNEQLQAAVVEQLTGWWGSQVAQWQHLRTYRIPFAQPNQVLGSHPLCLNHGI